MRSDTGAASALLRLLLPALALLALALPARPALAIDPSQLLPVEEAFALSGRVAGAERIDLRWEIAEGYYLYRHRARLIDAEGFDVDGELDLPPGEAYTDEFFGDVETYRHVLDASLHGALADGARSVRLELTYQGCADIGICYPPHRQTIELAVPAGLGAAAQPGLPGFGRAPGGDLFGGAFGATDSLPLPEAQAFRAEAIADGPEGLLLRLSPAPGYYLYRDNTTFAIRADRGRVSVGEVLWPEAVEHEDEFFGRSAVYFEPVDVPVRLLRSHTEATTITLQLGIQGCQDEGICYPPMERVFEIELPAGGQALLAGGSTPAAGTGGLGGGQTGLLVALLLALGGGVLLNLMPCVLPILSLKALSLAGSGTSPAQARHTALWYTLGVVVSFGLIGLLVLGLRSAGLALGWGFQLQQPLVVALLAYLMLAIGLNLSGVFSIGGRLAGVGQGLTEKSGAAGDFFTGVLAVLVASPCTAPFMGAALAFAFAAPPAVALGVFLMLGLGLALPFLLIGFIPGLASRLPRPGAWMEGFKQALAFPMYLVAVWLAWVLAKQRGADAIGLLLLGGVVLALGLWWLERARFSGRRLGRALALAVVLAALVPVWWLNQLPPPAAAAEAPESADRVAYSADRLQTLRDAGRVVFVNMTADWCVTCKANERRVLADAGFREALDAVDGVYMVGDWTNVDPAITAFLESHNAVGVPLYVVYPANGGEPRVLPTILTLGGVLGAIAEAGR